MNQLIFKQLGLVAYQETWQAMKLFSKTRNQNSNDEIWFCEHPKIFTIGCRNADSHILKPIDEIPIIQTDRGGLITHHGPGQIMMYVMIDLKRQKLGVRKLVHILQKVVMDTLQEIGIESYGDDTRPGVFVKLDNDWEAKICSIGLRISKGKSYHGLCLNYDMDLKPFKLINPCGFEGMKMTNITEIINGKLASKIEVINLLKVKISQRIEQ